MARVPSLSLDAEGRALRTKKNSKKKHFPKISKEFVKVNIKATERKPFEQNCLVLTSRQEVVISSVIILLRKIQRLRSAKNTGHQGKLSIYFM